MLLAAGHSTIFSKLCPAFVFVQSLEGLVPYRPLAGQRGVATEDSQGFDHKSAEVDSARAVRAQSPAESALLSPLVGIPVPWSGLPPPVLSAALEIVHLLPADRQP